MRYTIRVFDKLTLSAAAIFFLILISRLIISGASGLAEFIEKYYVIIGIILLIIVAGICVFIYHIVDSGISTANKVINCVASGFVLSQNASFLIYGLYRALTAYPNDAFLIFLGIGGFILFYIINTTITGFGIVLCVGKSWGSIVLATLAVVGFIFVSEW